MNKPADGEKFQEGGSGYHCTTCYPHFFMCASLGMEYHCLPFIGSKKKKKKEWGMRHSNMYTVFDVTLNNSGPSSSFKLLDSFSLTGPNGMLACLGQFKSAGSVLPNLSLTVNWVNSHL